MVKLKIDNYDVEVPAGTSILDAARTVQIEIPTLCKHPDVDPSAGCGMCIVRVNGRIMRSCCTPVSEGMEVITSDPELVDVRRTVLKLIWRLLQTIAKVRQIIKCLNDDLFFQFGVCEMEDG